MIDTLILLAALAALLVTLPGSVELLLITVAALTAKKSPLAQPTADPATLPRLAIVMPAHNEAAGISECVANLLTSLQQTQGCTLVVVADNCQDATATLAAQAGARVLERFNDVDRGKGYALDYAFRTLLAEDFDGFIVVDADSRVDVGFVSAFQHAFANGIDAAQCRYRIANPEASRRARLQYIAWLAFNELRLQGREQLKVSVGILGNGFALSRKVLETVPYEAGSIAEDMEYHLRLVDAGYAVRFLDNVKVLSDAPNQGDNAAVQRTRWEGGRFRLIREHVPLLFKGVLQGKTRLIEPLAELLLLPLAYHLLLLLATLLIPLPLLQGYAVAALLLVVAHVLLAIVLAGGNRDDFKVLATVPFYILWKLTLMPKLWRNARNDAQWQRTEREDS